MKTLTVIVERNSDDKKGVYGLSIHSEPGGAANIEPIKTKERLRERLLAFGLSSDYASHVIELLEKKRAYVRFEIEEEKAK